MSIDSIKHSKEKRVLIPSSEEAGYENGSPAVRDGKAKAEVPKNPVVHRGQDPELFWMHKYGPDDDDDVLSIDIRSLYRHEHIAPETLINRLYRAERPRRQQLDLAEMFGNGPELDEIDKIESYYRHANGWSNRLIQGDSLLVMTSLLEREGMAGKVQCIYIDPPYGIKYGSNWQIHINNRNVKDGDDDSLSGEPEQIRAYRDTWELGIHSYLSYLRDRLLVARDLLTETGSCFVQISDENVHLVRCLMDEVFGSENFVSLIAFQKKGSQSGDFLPPTHEFIVWYAHDKPAAKFRRLYLPRELAGTGGSGFDYVELGDGTVRNLTPEEKEGAPLPQGARAFRPNPLFSAKPGPNDPVEINGIAYPSGGNSWKVSPRHIPRLHTMGRIVIQRTRLRFKQYAEDFDFVPITNIWSGFGGAADMAYVVQTNERIIQRCILMTTDPGDLVLDPTCGSGTTAYVAEQWGRRWITIDTSRIALNIAKTRLMTATYPYYKLHDERGLDIRQGFVYKKVPHITLKSIANDEPPEEETLYDQPEIDRKKLRVSGPFTVETLQSFEPTPPEELDQPIAEPGELERFEERIFEHLKSAGVKTGVKEECAVFTRIQRLNGSKLHAEGFYQSESGERKAYLYIGPKFGTISRLAVNEAIKACRDKGDGDWLIILGFSFESNIETREVTTQVGSFRVTKARMHDDLMQDGLLKRDKKAASFVTIGEPDIHMERDGDTVTVEIKGLDIYDPIKDEVKPRDVADISYWMVDDDYDGSNFIARQVFFCGGDKDEFDKWKKGLASLAAAKARRDAEKTLKIEIDEDAFSRVYGHRSHPIEVKQGQRIAVRIISQFGEECTKVLTVNNG